MSNLHYIKSHMRTYQEGDNVENHRVRGHRMMLASFFILLSQQIQPRSKASLQISASKCGKTLHNTNLPAECPAFLTALHQLTIKDYFQVSQARYTWNAYSAKQTRVYGGGVRGMTVPTGIGLKFIQTPLKPPQRLVIFARNFFDIYYLLQYKKLQRALEAVCAASNSL